MVAQTCEPFLGQDGQANRSYCVLAERYSPNNTADVDRCILDRCTPSCLQAKQKVSLVILFCHLQLNN